MYGLKEFHSSPSMGAALAVHGALQLAKAMQRGSIICKGAKPSCFQCLGQHAFNGFPGTAFPRLIWSVACWVPLHDLHSLVDWFVIPQSPFSSVFLDQALCIKEKKRKEKRPECRLIHHSTRNY